LSESSNYYENEAMITSFFRKGFLTLFLLWFLPVLLKAQNIRFDIISAEQGLSTSTIRAVVQDKKGYVWIGTESGLNRYDGYSFRIYKHNPDDSTSLSSDNIKQLFVDQSGLLWIGTLGAGVCYYDYSTDSFVRIPSGTDSEQSLFGTEVDDIYEDKKGNVWFATIKGLSKYNKSNKKFTNFKEDKTNSLGLPSRYVKGIVQDRNDVMWAVHDAGLSKLEFVNEDSINFQNYLYDASNPYSVPSTYVKGIIEDQKGRIWVVSDGGLSRFDRETGKFYSYKADASNLNALSNTYCKAICEDSFGRIWVGHDTGVSIFDPETEKFTNCKHIENEKQSISNNYVKMLYKDITGTMWIGTDAGLNIYDPSKYLFELYQYKVGDKNSLISSYVYNIYEESESKVWLGTSGGLNLWDRKNNIFRAYTHEPNNPKSLSDNVIKYIFPSKKGGYWIGTDAGLNYATLDDKWNLTVEKKYSRDENNPNSLNKNAVVHLLEDSKGNLWVGTWGGGVSLFDEVNETFIPYWGAGNNPQRRLSGDRINFIYEDSKGNIIVGCDGLERFNRETQNFEMFDFFGKFDNRVVVLSFVEDWEGNYWLGTDKGLLRVDFKNQSITNITERDGLPSNIVNLLFVDNQKNIWTGTTKGLIKYNTENKSIRKFDSSDGLQGLEFGRNAIFKNKNGEVYLGGVNGLNVFHPDKISNNTYIPPVHITSFYLFNKEVKISDGVLDKSISETKEITLSHKDQIMSFEFVGLNYRNSHKNQYAYKLDGFQNDWIYTSADRRNATFTNLNPGEYILRIKASNNDGIWNEEGTIIKINVLPPWWKTWWAQTLFAALIIGSAVSFYKARTNILKAQKRKLEKMVEERTAELKQANVQLQEQKEEILVQNEELHQQAEEIAAQRDRIEDQHRSLESAYSDIHLVSEIGRDITSTLSLDIIMNTLYDNLNKMMPADTFAIGVYSKERMVLGFTGIDDRKNIINYGNDYLSEANNLSVWCFTNNQPIHINDFEAEYKKYINEKPRFWNGQKSMMYLPLFSKGQSLGVITVQSMVKNAYESRNMTVFQSLAAYVATALDNSQAYEIIKLKNDLITDSIRYALTIQQAILPTQDKFSQLFADHFILFRPKDIVSGDFYWYAHLPTKDGMNERHYVATVDCTGHGVPGAFMSMIGNSILNELAIEKGIVMPSQILEGLNEHIRTSLKQNRGGKDVNSDGMDITLCMFEKRHDGKVLMTFSGAKTTVYYTTQNRGEVFQIKGDKKSIGGHQVEGRIFTDQEKLFTAGDVIYLTTDGYIDQNNPQREKLGSLRFINLLENNTHLSLSVQKEELERALDAHQQESEQRDDITVLGLRV
jgi:ligand-binding sensor domain-containing protein/serine phosphatase RsbU (regulator of sigma subunit)